MNYDFDEHHRARIWARLRIRHGSGWTVTKKLALARRRMSNDRFWEWVCATVNYPILFYPVRHWSKRKGSFSICPKHLSLYFIFIASGKLHNAFEFFNDYFFIIRLTYSENFWFSTKFDSLPRKMCSVTHPISPFPGAARRCLLPRSAVPFCSRSRHILELLPICGPAAAAGEKLTKFGPGTLL
jgi:hypothetical protein